MTPRDDRPVLTRLFEPASIDEQAPIARVLTYALLALWSLWW
jgi:multiple sugar transport system permease protein